MRSANFCRVFPGTQITQTRPISLYFLFKIYRLQGQRDFSALCLPHTFKHARQEAWPFVAKKDHRKQAAWNVIVSAWWDLSDGVGRTYLSITPGSCRAERILRVKLGYRILIRFLFLATPWSLHPMRGYQDPFSLQRIITDVLVLWNMSSWGEGTFQFHISS
jgi:hypothetical protein